MKLNLVILSVTSQTSIHNFKRLLIPFSSMYESILNEFLEQNLYISFQMTMEFSQKSPEKVTFLKPLSVPYGCKT